MTPDYVTLATRGVQGLQPYQPGKPIEELQRELGLTNVVKLASNENPLGPGELAVKAMSDALHDITRYPDGNGFVLKSALAERYDLTLEQLTLGNGSNDVLELVVRAYAGPGDEVIYSQHAFAVYALATQAVGATAVVTPAQQWGHDLEAMAASVSNKTRILFVANPNNPTGTWSSREAVQNLLDRVPGNVIVVIDEAYFEYVTQPNYPNALQWLSNYPNLVVVRTFSKVHGLAGLRVGYACSSAQIANVLNRVRQPFNVNSVAMAGASAALADHAHISRSVQVNLDGMRWLQDQFEALGLTCIDSVGNFLAVDFARPADAINESLLRHGIIVRPIGGYGMPNHLRVSVGLESENAALVSALREVLTEV